MKEEEEENPGGAGSKGKDKGGAEEGKGGKVAPERKEPEAVTVEPKPTPELKNSPMMQGASARCDKRQRNPGDATIRYKKRMILSHP